jgi:hypothetical protein
MDVNIKGLIEGRRLLTRARAGPTVIPTDRYPPLSKTGLGKTNPQILQKL